VRRLLALVVLVAALALPPLAAGSDSGIRGVVLNTTCAGPCAYPPPPPPPYTGDGLTVRVRHLPDGEVVAVRHPKDGRFRIELAPGLYRVRAKVDGPCWDGEAKRVRVYGGQFTGVRLHVSNGCVV
jgi:hypothetical protein